MHYHVGLGAKVELKLKCSTAPDSSNDQVHLDINKDWGWVCIGCDHRDDKSQAIKFSLDQGGCCGCGEHNLEWRAKISPDFEYDYIQDQERVVKIRAKANITISDGTQMSPGEEMEFVIEDGAKMWVKDSDGLTIKVVS